MNQGCQITAKPALRHPLSFGKRTVPTFAEGVVDTAPLPPRCRNTASRRPTHGIQHLDATSAFCQAEIPTGAADGTKLNFRILGRISQTETIARGTGIRELPRLRRTYGHGNWLKRKGTARVQLANGGIRLAELHWYEAHGIGRREVKRKRYLD